MPVILLLTISNLFMTIAWYWHIKGAALAKPLVAVILISWVIALAEYCFAVPANRLGAKLHRCPRRNAGDQLRVPHPKGQGGERQLPPGRQLDTGIETTPTVLLEGAAELTAGIDDLLDRPGPCLRDEFAADLLGRRGLVHTHDARRCANPGRRAFSRSGGDTDARAESTAP